MNDLIYENLSTIPDVDKKKWNDFIKRSPFTSIYYRYEFLQAVEEGLLYEPRHIVVAKDGNIIGVFPNFIQPIPRLPFKLLFSLDPGYGGPLIGKHEHPVLSLMMDQISKFCKRTILAHYIQTQDPFFIRYHHFLENRGYRLNCRYSNALISLKDKTYMDIKKRYYKEKTQALNKMKKEDFTITDIPVTLDSLSSFHKGYMETMQRVGGVPLPLTFLIALKKHLPDRLKLITLFLNEKNIGEQLYLIDKEQNSLVAWILSIKEEHHRYHPTTVMHDHMIQWAIQNKFHTYDLGYTLSDFHDGLFRYKEEFGATATPILSWEKSYSIIPLDLIKYGGRLYKRFFRSEH